MVKRLKPVELRGRHVLLEPLSVAHADDLLAAANVDRSTYNHTTVPGSIHAMNAYIAGLLADARAGQVLPFTQRMLAADGDENDRGVPVGCTRYLDLKWWPTGETPSEIEIGGTWLGADAQRTAVNTEAKLLLLTYAFEVLGVWRVAINTDANNTRSRTAIERIGATFEGVLRNHRLGQGSEWPSDAPPYRHTAVHSVIVEEWPSVRDRLRERLNQEVL